MTIWNQIQAPATQKVQTAEAYLQNKHNELGAYESLEALGVDGEEHLDQSTYSGLMHHMLVIRSELAKVLWRHEIYIGISIIDELVFQSAKKAPAQICQDVLSFLSKSHAGNSGFVLYPLHGFGIEQAPFLRSDPELKPFLHFRSMGICLSPQSNSLGAAFSAFPRWPLGSVSWGKSILLISSITQAPV